MATLLFSIFKGVGGSIKLRKKGLQLSMLLDFLSTLESESEGQQTWMDMLIDLFEKLFSISNPADTKILWTILEVRNLNP